MARPEESTRIVQLRARLLGISPMIWRRVLVPAFVSLHELHGILQVSMGWEGIHLYYFDIYAAHYGSFELSTESPDTALSRFRFREGGRFAYLYDMGDYWEHEVRVEKFLDRDSKKTYPVCTGGSGACPPRGLRRPRRIPGMAGRTRRAGMRGPTGTWSSALSSMSWRAAVLGS